MYNVFVRMQNWSVAWLARDLGDVLRLHPLSALRHLVRDFVAFFEGLEPTACYARVVYEEVFATIIRGDEAVALLAIEPLNRSLGHVLKPTFLVGMNPTK